MLIKLSVEDIDDKIVQPGESVTVGNFIWSVYTTVSTEDWQKYFNDAGDDAADAADEENHDDSYDYGPQFSVYVECKPIDPTMSFECLVDIAFVEQCNFHNRRSQGFIINQIFNDTEIKSNIVGTYGERDTLQTFIVELNVKSFEIFPPKCFTSPKPNLTDIELIVGDKTFYASKHILAQHSKKFYEMIFGKDRPVDRLEIKDVSPEDFLLFIELLYDCEKGVRWSSIEKIADLSILYDSSECLKKCEMFLIRQNVCNLDRWTYRSAFLLAKKYCNKYGFKTLLHQILYWSEASEICDALEEEGDDRIDEKYRNALAEKLDELIAAKKYQSEKVGTDVQPFIALIDQESIGFSKPRDNLTDIVLSVGDKKYHVSKQILANASTYFNAMFYGNFNEKNETVIELKEIDEDEFEEFLQHVYNPERIFNQDNIDYLVRLPHFFDASYNLRQCQKYILNSDSFNDAQKIYMARKYQLSYLFDQVVFKYQTMKDFKKFSLLEDYGKIDTLTIGEMTRKILEHHTEKDD